MPGSHQNLGPQWNNGITSANLQDMRTSYSVYVDPMDSSEAFLFSQPHGGTPDILYPDVDPAHMWSPPQGYPNQ